MAALDASNGRPSRDILTGSTGVYLNAGRALNAYYDDLTERPIDSTAPTTPTALTGTPVAAGRIDLTWTASTDTTGVAGYNVYRDTTKINTAPVGSTSYSDTGLTAGASHTYKVSAVDAAGNESAQSTSWAGAAASGAVTTTYSYDPENRLTALQSGSTVLGTYAYDGAGDRISKTVGTSTTAYTLDLASSLPEVLSETTGSATTSYAYAGGPLEIDQAGTTYWYLADTLGSVRLLTDSTGATPATYAYSAFGSTRKTSGSITNEVRFTGERTDTESGLEFLRARTYDPSTGTFLQRDSWGIAPTNSQSIDAYLYTANDPANAVDPSGHDPWWEDSYAAAGIDVGTFVMPGTIAKSGSGAYVPHVTGKTQGAPPTPTFTKPSSTPQQPCDNVVCGFTNKVGDAAGGLGNLWAQGPGGFINDHALQITVIAIIAGSLFVCNVGSEACAAILLTVLEAGGTVCAENDEACVEAAERAGGGAAEAALQISPKIAGQMQPRGWTPDLIQETYQNPAATHSVWDYTSGTQEAATAYVRSDGSYVVVNNATKAVVQVSKIGDPMWKPVWEDPRFQR